VLDFSLKDEWKALKVTVSLSTKFFPDSVLAVETVSGKYL
jgi:hypothetical protein